METKLYTYKGPILLNDNCVKKTWRAETQAFDKNDAYNRFVMMCRHTVFDFLDGNVKVTLPGQLLEVNV